MRKLVLLMLLAVGVAASAARPAVSPLRAAMKSHPRISGNNYQAYPDTLLPALTPAPEGYTPFFINHYGRHGSRWLIDGGQYTRPLRALEKAQRDGVLTRRGAEVMAVLRDIAAASEGRLGELSDIGAEQHQGIARRMVENFPEVFTAPGSTVNARSTTVIRCILSMQNEVDQLMAMCPNLLITTDASKSTMYYMNYGDPVIKPLRKQAMPAVNDRKQRWVRTGTMAKRLFSSAKWARDSVDLMGMMLDLMDVAGNMQSHHAYENVNLFDLWTADELYDTWRYNNARWYIYSGNNPLTGGRVPYIEANLLRNLIEDADHAVAHGVKGASMRFGHESVVLPLVALMDINGAGYSTDDLDNLDQHWASSNYFPMAANLQLVYYRNAEGDVLVKVLLNEHESTLPLEPVTGPYYRWADVRDHYLQVLAAVPAAPLPIE